MVPWNGRDKTAEDLSHTVDQLHEGAKQTCKKVVDNTKESVSNIRSFVNENKGSWKEAIHLKMEGLKNRVKEDPSNESES